MIWDTPPEPPESNGKYSCLTVIAFVLIAAMIVALLLQGLDTQWPIP
jgi:hypothetical protein